MLWAVEWVMTPGDMNIKHSPHPLDTAANMHGALVNAATETLTEKGLVQGTRELSAIATAVIAENVDPFKKLRAADKLTEVAAETLAKEPAISWNDYAHLLGTGSQAPKLKPLRDFSDLMEYESPKPWREYSRLSYIPHPDHKIIMDLTHGYDWHNESQSKIISSNMEFIVKAGSDRNLHGSGAEMFHSAMKLLQGHGIDIDRIDANWGHGELSTNYDKFAESYAHGSSVKQAISKTPTGKYMADAGFTEVGGWHFNQTISSGSLAGNLHPEFRRPVFSDDKSYNDYGRHWAESQGRTSLDLIPRHQSAEVLPASPKLELPLSELSAAQAEALRQYMHEHIEKHFDSLISGRHIEPEVK